MEREHDAETGSAQDPLGATLEIGLVAVLVLAPLPFGSVRAPGRPAFELAALALGAVWTLRGLTRGNALPRRALIAGVAVWIALACLQLLPLGDAAVRFVSPHADSVRTSTIPQGAALAAESRLLGVDPATLDPTATLSVAPGDTASALRTGVACAFLMLVAATVAAERGLGRVAAALLASAALQGLYGILVVASGHDQVWHVAKRSYLDSATGTFINRNHFAGYVAMATSLGLAWLTGLRARDLHPGASAKRLPDAAWGRWAVALVLAVLAFAGLLASLSRTGIALGLAGGGWVLWSCLPHRGRRTRLMIIGMLAVAAAMPIARLGPQRLASRYSAAVADLGAPGGRATVWNDTLEMAGSFPIVGAGFGAFRSAYPEFRSPEVRLYYAHAHSDLIQLAAEGGLAALAALLCVAAALRRPLWRALRGAHGRIAVGAAVALAIFALHGLIDFNAHIPSNLAMAATLAGFIGVLPGEGR